MFTIALVMMMTATIGLYIQKQIISKRVRVLDVKGEVRELYRRQRRQWYLDQMTPLNRSLMEAQYCLKERQVLKNKAYDKMINPETLTASKSAEKRARQL